jgi:hypothetical protein
MTERFNQKFTNPNECIEKSYEEHINVKSNTSPAIKRRDITEIFRE